MMKFRSGIILLMFIAIWGCSNGSNNAVILDTTGKHPAGWVVALNGGNHPATYLAAPDKCQECHGTDLKGGISNVSCFSPDRNGITCHAQGPSGHPVGWNAPAQHGAHAKAAAIGVNGMAFCTNCHGANYRGAGTAQKDCLRCHTRAPHPDAPWFIGTSTRTSTHKDTDPTNAPACAVCHTGRANLSPAGIAALPATAIIGATGCFNNTLCHGVMGHSSDPQPWNLAVNHGARAKADPSTGGNTGFAACQQCHGAGFSTLLGGFTCFTCHATAPHPVAANWRATGTVTHTTTGLANAAVCSSCHNSTTPNLAAPNLARFANSPAGSFKVGTPDCFSASLCHGDVRKTSNCDACHSTATTNPFKSLAGATATSDAKVGAHVSHLLAAAQVPAYSANVACSECHTVPGVPTVSGTHRNNANNINFGTLATKNGALLPAYTAATGICANTYCHGASLTGGGANKAPVWNQANYLTTSGCATCHGFPPTTVRNGAAAHSASATCNTCHTHVNATNNGFTAAGAVLHINGAVDAAGGAAPHAVPNYNHQAAGTGAACTGCHAIGTVTSVYPAAILGNAPDCRGCHRKAAPGVGCGSCHGDATGRPNGAAFPDKNGQHSRGEHNVACTVCHVLGATAGTGATVNHGPGNRGANPNVVGPGFTTGIVLTGGTKGTSPAASCNHNATLGGGCGNGQGTKSW